MQEKNQFTNSIPVDDSAYRLTDGDWEDWFRTDIAEQPASEPAQEAPQPSNGYENEIVNI